MSERKYDLVFPSRIYEVRVDSNALYGYFEYIGNANWECGGGLWFERDDKGRLVLMDYDGVGVLPSRVVEVLRDGGVDISAVIP